MGAHAAWAPHQLHRQQTLPTINAADSSYPAPDLAVKVRLAFEMGAEAEKKDKASQSRCTRQPHIAFSP